MDYWPNQEDNGHCGPIRKKQDRGAVLSPKYEANIW